MRPTAQEIAAEHADVVAHGGGECGRIGGIERGEDLIDRTAISIALEGQQVLRRHDVPVEPESITADLHSVMGLGSGNQIRIGAVVISAVNAKECVLPDFVAVAHASKSAVLRSTAA